MTPSAVQTKTVRDFSCLGDKCPDTCCRGWGMQLTQQTLDLYTSKAPALLDAVVTEDSGAVMKRDPATDVCVKFDAGWCSIQREYGEEFLGDACHFFPRITRALGTTVITTAALSCPETARQMLYSPDAFVLGERQPIRTPYLMRNYLPDGITQEQALEIHDRFLQVAGDASYSAGMNLMRVSTVARALEMQPIAAWPEALPLYLMMAEGRIPKAEPAATDIYNLIHALHGLMSASPGKRDRLVALVMAIADMLGVRFNEQGALVFADDSPARCNRARAIMRLHATSLHPVFLGYVRAQMSQALFPFAGFGETLTERVTMIGLRFALARMAVASLGEAPGKDEVVHTIQTLSRFLDHLADPRLSVEICRETGWLREPRLRAIVELIDAN